MTDVVDRPARKGLRPAATPAAKPADENAAPAVDVEALGRQLLGKWADVRLQARDLAGRPELHKTEGLTHTEHRTRVLGQL